MPSNGAYREYCKLAAKAKNDFDFKWHLAQISPFHNWQSLSEKYKELFEELQAEMDKARALIRG